jgi:hypothetical protein
MPYSAQSQLRCEEITPHGVCGHPAKRFEQTVLEENCGAINICSTHQRKLIKLGVILTRIDRRKKCGLQSAC